MTQKQSDRLFIVDRILLEVAVAEGISESRLTIRQSKENPNFYFILDTEKKAKKNNGAWIWYVAEFGGYCDLVNKERNRKAALYRNFRKTV